MRHAAMRYAALALLALAAACSSSPKDSLKGYVKANPHEKVGDPYQVKGVWYVPKHEPNYNKYGQASWYGPKFHGRLTANGEIFDQDRLTAAHPTLPLPSIVEVTNPANGKKLRLRVNDRGPFANGRIIDLSREAAVRLGTRQQGVAPVRVRYIGPARLDQAITATGQRERGQSLALLLPQAPRVKPYGSQPGLTLPSEQELLQHASLSPGGRQVRVQNASLNGAALGLSFYVQLGAFADEQNAYSAAARLPGDYPVRFEPRLSGGRALTLVRVGPYGEQIAASDVLDYVRGIGFMDARIVEEVLN
ncbi:MAG: septal ring lytic transglycosylase RlpA family protein [Pseudomonadota bacterium]